MTLDHVPKGIDGEKHFVYLACCANGTLYVGYTKDVSHRLAVHNAGYGGRYTRRNRPLSLLATRSFERKGDALRAERAIKHLSPEQKRLFFAKTAFSQDGETV